MPVDGAAGLARCGDGDAVLHGDLVGAGADGDLGGLAAWGRPTWIRGGETGISDAVIDGGRYMGGHHRFEAGCSYVPV